MCGISGVLNFNVTKPVDPRVLERMTVVQAHRGPDDSGYFIDRNIGLGHRRLSIIDLSGGKQPIFNEDGSAVVVFNGEIYNYAELTAKLIAKGHRFKTRCDTETIVHAYEEYGEECVHDFRGMFAFAVWDARNRRLFIARDRLGIKPLYYYVHRDAFIFGSEIKALLEHPDVPREMDPVALDLYLSLRYVPGPRTMFKNIFKLQPGHTLVVDEKGIRQHKYWDINYSACELSERESVERFEALLEESVRLRLISEAPLGVFLSGGVDSSAIVAVMSKITNRERVTTFSVGYDTAGPSARTARDANELDSARMVAQHFGTDHHERRITAMEFADAIPTIVGHLDEPLADPSCIPLYFISKLARKYITVILSGEGADEILGGYSLYKNVLRIEKARGRMGRLSQLGATLASLLPSDRIRSYARRARIPLENHYRGVVRGLLPEVRLDLTGADRFRASEQTLDEVFGEYFQRVKSASTLNQMLYVDAKVWLPEDLLLKADKITMAAGVELRVPFLDHKLLEFAASLKDGLKIGGGKGKWILREAMRNTLPPAILSRPKRGFPSPANSWLRFELSDFVTDTILGSGSACRQYFRPQALESLTNRHREGRSQDYQDVWSLILFENWHKHFIADFRTRPLERAVAPELQASEC